MEQGTKKKISLGQIFSYSWWYIIMIQLWGEEHLCIIDRIELFIHNHQADFFFCWFYNLLKLVHCNNQNTLNTRTLSNMGSKSFLGMNKKIMTAINKIWFFIQQNQNVQVNYEQNPRKIFSLPAWIDMLSSSFVVFAMPEFT